MKYFTISLKENEMNRPKIVCLCGSTKFKEDFLAIQKEETLKGNIVLSVGFFGHADNEQLSNDVKAKLDMLHLAKIDLADEVIVINKNYYVGDSTRREIEYSYMRNKKVRFTYCKHLRVKHKFDVEVIGKNMRAITRYVCEDCDMEVNGQSK